jgi:hypothetical protein
LAKKPELVTSLPPPLPKIEPISAKPAIALVVRHLELWRKNAFEGFLEGVDPGCPVFEV